MTEIETINNITYIFPDSNTLKAYKLIYYEVNILLYSGQSKKIIILYRKQYENSWHLTLRAFLNELKIFNSEVVLIENWGELKPSAKKSEKFYFNFYRKSGYGEIFHHTYTYHPVLFYFYNDLPIEETESMAFHSLKRLYPDFYINKISTNKNNMELSEKNIIVKQLREKSQGSLKVCNDIITKILEENKSGLTIPEIIEKGMAEMASHKLIIAAKRDNNGSNFFSINTFISPFDYKGIIIKFGCESEQGLKSLKTTYKDILDKITELCLANDIEYISDALGLPFDDSKSIYTTLKEISGSLNENISITDLEIAESISNIPNTYMEEYIHSDSSSDKSGGLIIYNCKDETMKESVRKILHQLVYTNPLCLKKNELVKSIIEETTIDVRENIIKENELVDQLTSKVEKLTLIDKLGEDLKTELKEAKATLKSIKKVKEDFIEKAVESKLNKFISEVSFEEQEYMFYKEEELPKQTIKKYLESKGITIFDYVVV